MAYVHQPTHIDKTYIFLNPWDVLNMKWCCSVENIKPPPKLLSHRPVLNRAGNIFRAGKIFRTGNPLRTGNPNSRTPESTGTVPMDPAGLPLAIPEWVATCLPRKGRYPRTRGGWVVTPPSDLPETSAFPTRVSAAVTGMFQILSATHYMITPDSSGLRGLLNRIPL